MAAPWYTTRNPALRTQSEELNKDIDVLTEKILIDTQLIKILGDDGIKSYFFKKLIKILNKSVNEYLNKFELTGSAPHEFDD